MVLDLGFLGDTVHLLPALWLVRQAYPRAELHVMVAQHVVSLMECVPWVDGVWGYSRFPKHASLAENLRTVHRLRKKNFEVVINLNGSDRSSWLIASANGSYISAIRSRCSRELSRTCFCDHSCGPRSLVEIEGRRYRVPPLDVEPATVGHLPPTFWGGSLTAFLIWR